MADSKQIAEEVLAAVGGPSNVTSVTHCITRLRFNLKDESIPNTDEIKGFSGVLGAQWSGGQYQVIIGQNVPQVYDEVVKMGVTAAGAVDENLDPEMPKDKLTPKRAFDNVLNYLSKSMIAVLPIMMGAAMFRTLSAILGPDVFGVVSADSNLYLLCNAMFNAGFYFMPIYLGYSAAKTIGATPVLGMLMGGALIAPDLVNLAGQPFDIYGIPTTMANYSQTVLPILLSVAAMSYVERFVKRAIPTVLSSVFVPFLTMAIMLPISFCLLAPIGSWGGALISNVLQSFTGPLGIVGAIIMGGFWEFLVITGMHVTLGMFIMTTMIEQGSLAGAMVGPYFAAAALWGMCAGAFLRIKNKEEKANVLGYLISAFIGGVTEPALYGLGFKYRRSFIGLIVGGAVGTVFAVIAGVTRYTLGGGTGFLTLVVPFSGGSASNFTNSLIAYVISFVIGAVVTYFFGFTKKDLEMEPETI